MSKKAYSPLERQQLRIRLLDAGQALFAQQGLQRTTLARVYGSVGISKTFFYSYFPSKEEFVAQVLFHQQPKLLRHAQGLLDQLPWREAAERFFNDCCYGSRSGFYIMTLEEQQAVYRKLSNRRLREFRETQLGIFRELLGLFGVPAGDWEAMLFANLSVSIIMVRSATPESMPLLFPEAADETARLQIAALVDHLERQRRQ